MHKTLLLCFIHGFKGGDDTFAGFPEHLRTTLGHALPKLTVRTIVYPKYETRGDLKECVGRFLEWLQNAVIDLEVANGTPSPTVDPAVRVILVGHSMGGIVAAETYRRITSDAPISRSQPADKDEDAHAFMFPYVQGVLAFDTPYLGIAPGVVAHGAEAQYQTASNAYSAFTSAASVFGFGRSSTPSTPSASMHAGAAPAAAAPISAADKTALSKSVSDADTDAAAAPAWQRWGRYAMFAGAAGAVAAGGAAAYMNRDAISSGWGWATSHLEFVGCLMRGEELKERVGAIADAGDARGTGFVDFYTTLGAAAKGDGPRRSFCNLPTRDDWKPLFRPAANERAQDEVEAHMGMFMPRNNPGFYALVDDARDAVVGWVDRHWYEASEPKAEEVSQGNNGVNRPKKVAKDVSGDGASDHLGGEEPVLV